MKNSPLLRMHMLLSILIFFTPRLWSAEKILDHKVVLDSHGRLLPWTSFENIISWSVNFIKTCPTMGTKFGEDPWYLVTAKFNEDGTYLRKQNNQGSNVYWGMKTAKKYYAYSGDDVLLRVVRSLIDRVLLYCTPAEWVWHDVPRTQDDTPDGEYTDEWAEPDKMCMVAIGCIDFYKYSGEQKYLDAAKKIARTVIPFIQTGDAEHSPLPFRVHLQTGRVMDTYDAGLISVVEMIDQLLPFLPGSDQAGYLEKRDMVMQWILKVPMTNYNWSGYYEDVVSQKFNLNQHTPMETARYILQSPVLDRDYKAHVPDLIKWVENRFGKTKRYGATSIKEQDSCFMEMSSHTARYASVVAMWYGVSQDKRDREEARAAFNLATYSAYNKFSKGDRAINYVGIGYSDPWFSDSYFDYLTHIFDGMAEIPTMMNGEGNHLFKTTSVVKSIQYGKVTVHYKTFEKDGTDWLQLSFKPKVLASGKPLDAFKWSFGEYREAKNVLIIHRQGVDDIRVVKAD
jgi:hypothetical protein